MANTPSDILKTDALTENLLSFHSVVKQSYSHAKKHLQDGVAFVKEEIMDIYDTAGSCLTKMVLPVNNFLKDLTQIEEEFQHEINREMQPVKVVNHNCNIIPIEQALSGYMEENY
ncbi:MAG TPA: hypothetical protein VF487_21355 [Chitinophagaceae bacterium]